MLSKKLRTKLCSMSLGNTWPIAAIVISALSCVPVLGGQTTTQRLSVPLGNSEVVRETRKYENFAVSESPAVNKLVFRKVRLDLKPVSKDSAIFHVKKKDNINFICSEAETGFNGGDVVATVMSDQGQENGIHTYTLDRCAAKK